MSGLYEAAHLAAGPDEVRGSQSLSKSRALSAASRTGCLDPRIDRFASRFVAPFPKASKIAPRTFCQPAETEPIRAVDRYGAFLMSTAHATRANLFARATETRRAGFLLSSFLTHSNSDPGQFNFAERRIDVAPMTSRVRKYPLPAFVMRPSRSLLPEELCRGVSPSHAAIARPEPN